jgi:hypothetical protein
MLFILVQCRFLCLQKVLGLLVVCLQIWIFKFSCRMCLPKHLTF